MMLMTYLALSRRDAGFAVQSAHSEFAESPGVISNAALAWIDVRFVVHVEPTFSSKKNFNALALNRTTIALEP